MPKRGYKYVLIPEVLYEKIKKHVDASGGRYVSISEVVREAVWKLLNASVKDT
jgi:Arc/MetJ-type ribon-helix-helix transcriptional regulator